MKHVACVISEPVISEHVTKGNSHVTCSETVRILENNTDNFFYQKVEPKRLKNRQTMRYNTTPLREVKNCFDPDEYNYSLYRKNCPACPGTPQLIPTKAVYLPA